MRMDKKLEHYLRDCCIDFKDEMLIEVIPQDDNNAVVLTAPRSHREYSYYRLMYKGAGLYYNSIETMMNACVDVGYVSRRNADKVIRDYMNRIK